jgi:hypothetical protein
MGTSGTSIGVRLLATRRRYILGVEMKSDRIVRLSATRPGACGLTYQPRRPCVRRVNADRIVSAVDVNPAIFRRPSGARSTTPILPPASAEVSPRDVYEDLLVADIVSAADLLRPGYDETAGLDGYASLEARRSVRHGCYDAEAKRHRVHRARMS